MALTRFFAVPDEPGRFCQPTRNIDDMILQKQLRNQSMSRGIRYWLLILFSGWMAGAPAHATPPPCGAPRYDATSDHAIFLWRDCSTGHWSLRAMGGGSHAAAVGELSATYPIRVTARIDLGATDDLQSVEPTRLRYSLQLWGLAVNGFDFDLPADANATFDLTATGLPVLVGPDRILRVPPFDLLDLAGDPKIPNGAPTYDRATEQEVFLWRSVDGVWHVRSTAGGTVTRFTGHITADRAFSGVSGVKLEYDDMLDSSNPARIGFDLIAKNGEDGIDFSFPADGRACFTLENPNQAVLVGAQRTPIIGTFNPQTLTPCAGETPDPGGTPVYDPASQAAAFLWGDKLSNRWQLRVTAGSGSTKYSGTIVSSAPIVKTTPIAVESDDVVDVSDSSRIAFDFSVAKGSRDGIEFQLPAGAHACFTLNGTSPIALVGAGKTPVTTPVDLATMGPCAPVGPQMNLVVIMTDDQRFDTLPWMPTVTGKLMTQGVTFNNAYVPTPLCCPTRASMFSGGYLAQNTGVIDNAWPNGGMTRFDDRQNLGVTLQNAGYETFYVGKWLNDYWRLGQYVPPGWSRFIGRNIDMVRPDWSNNITYIVGSSDRHPSVGTESTLSGQYITYYERDQVLDFLEHAPTDRPFFVVWSTAAPHTLATPAPEDEHLFAGYLYRDRSVGEADLSDKPQWLQKRIAAGADDEFVRNQLRSLQSVDRSIAAIVDKLAAMGELNNTLVVFLSDNGHQWGEHGNKLWDKGFPYEESIRVPMVILMPGVMPRVDNHFVSASLDLGPTLYELAGVPRQTEGTSLVSLLKNPATPWRDELYFEGYSTQKGGSALWAAVRRNEWKYIRYWTGEEELYDLASDPHELESRHNDPALSTLKSTLGMRTTQLLGLAVTPVQQFQTGKVNGDFSFTFMTWGGVAPFSWQVATGQIPPGLVLDEATGTLHGVPSAPGTFNFTIRVTDASIATQARRPRTFVTGPLKITVNP